MPRRSRRQSKVRTAPWDSLEVCSLVLASPATIVNCVIDRPWRHNEIPSIGSAIGISCKYILDKACGKYIVALKVINPLAEDYEYRVVDASTWPVLHY